MFIIQYVAVNGESKMQNFDSGSRIRLAAYLARFQHPILAVYERGTPITKLMQTTLRNVHGDLSPRAREFAFAS
jgi:hypothetical protein